ncbi:hypothetical protein [Streptomyces sp. NPDC091299]|uniref:hypothetical protein n=1 Tax=Streptomyces sp. NPDC091299 TaxID=3155302 RepID=UPI00342A64E9
MNTLVLDPGLAAVVDFVREHNQQIEQAIGEGRPVSPFDYAVLSGAVSALLDAVDARLPQQQTKAVA